MENKVANMGLPKRIARASVSALILGAMLSMIDATVWEGHGRAQSQKPSNAVPKAAAKALSGQVIIILAHEKAGKTDPELKKMEALQKPPFSGFKSMRVLGKQQLSLSAAKPVTVGLPNGRRMQIEMLSVAEDGRYKVRVSINKPSTKDYLPGMVVAASAGEPFFVAGQKHEGGTLVIGIRVGNKAKGK